MDRDFSGKIVFVTGGSKGIGLACAQLLEKRGARVAIASRSQANVDAALTLVKSASGFTADLSDAQAAADVVDAVERQMGPIDILINSAGAARRTPLAEMRPEHWRVAMDAKYFTYVYVIDPLIKRMAARGAGVIVNIIGIGGKAPIVTHLAGGAANAALMLVTAGLAVAYAPKGIRVVGINPGMTLTERVDDVIEADARNDGSTKEKTLQQTVERIPLGRMADPEEIAEAAVFLASGKASYITGVTINMDGAAYPTI